MKWLNTDVKKLFVSEIEEDSYVLKEASNNYAEEFRKKDKLCNSPVRSKFLSQNYIENYLVIEGICKNMNIS